MTHNGTEAPRTTSSRTQAAVRADAWTRLFTVLMLAGLGLVMLRVIQLKVLPDAKFLAAVSPQFSSRPEFGRRGDLLDARGRILATSTVGYRLFVDPAEVEDPGTIAVDIAGAIGVPPIDIDRKILAAAGRRYVVIDHLLDERQVEAIRTARLRGVGLEPRPVRHYPHGDLAAAVIGQVGFEDTGLSGAEHALQRMLEPKPGTLTYLRDAARRALWVEPGDYDPARHGRDVRLSIDLVIQQSADRLLREGVERHNAGGGRVVVMDVRTGGILAMCDVLNVRPGHQEVTTDPARAVHPALGRNRCVTDPYEPGSTMKPFVWATATELGLVAPSEIIPTPESGVFRTRYGRPIHDSHAVGSASWRTVLIQSVNSGMAIVAERMTHEQMRLGVARFGFGIRTFCGFTGESSGILPGARKWSHYTQTSVAIGHEIAVTPVQMARAFSAFARDGTMPPLHITGETEADASFELRQRACSEPVARLVRAVLHDAVLEGTGRPARSERYELFGKSGTAQLAKPGGGGYFEGRYVSSFIAGAPFDAPRLVVLCVIDDPDKSRGYYGGPVAGPIVRDIMDEALAYLGVPGASDAPPAARQTAMAR